MAEAKKLAYADRAAMARRPGLRQRAGQGPDLKGLCGASCARRIAPDRARARRARSRPASPQPYESDQTTHFSVVDADGNAVANTYTLNLSYGVGLVADGTGVLLNNELDDFAAKPGAANAFGLIGGDANAPGAAQAPAVVDDARRWCSRTGELELVTGSPGGSRIITTVLQIILDIIDHGLNVAEAEDAPRVHDQLAARRTADRARHFARHASACCEAMGHKVVAARRHGLGQHDLAQRPTACSMGASDPRQRGTLAVGD